MGDYIGSNIVRLYSFQGADPCCAQTKPHVRLDCARGARLRWLPPSVLHRPPPRVKSSIRIPFEKYKLAQRPDGDSLGGSHDADRAVNVWYHVGSKNELPGRTGFAHLFEHIMFPGSGHVPYGLHDKLTEGVGGSNNGTTSNDRTTYFETVPSNYLRVGALDRVGPDGFPAGKLDLPSSTRSATSSRTSDARAWTISPTAASTRFSRKATYPPSNPYSWDVIGSMEDLTAASERT